MNTILYINPLNPYITFLISDGGSIIEKTLEKNLDTASTFPRLLVEIVDLYQIQEIYCITGPGPFTLMRVVTLAINALTYTRDIRVKSCHFFDLITSPNQAIIEANPREYLIREHDEVISITKWALTKWAYEGIFSETTSTEWVKLIQYVDSWERILVVFWNQESASHISPIYFKPPHITWSQQPKIL
jgi:hypothetical protein